MYAVRFFLIFLMTAMCFAVHAENYIVYSVHGPVWEHTVKGNVPIAIKDSHLKGDSEIVIGKGGSLTLYCVGSKKLVSINEIGRQRLSTLLKRGHGTITSNWVKALLESLLKSKAPELTRRRVLQSQGGSHRGSDNDKALQNAFANYLTFETVPEWKTQACMPPAAKVNLTPENNLFLPPEEFGRRGHFYFGLSAFEGF